MVKKPTIASSAPTAEEAGTTVLGAAQDVISNPPEVASAPSGMNGPDGIILEGGIVPPAGDGRQTLTGDVSDVVPNDDHAGAGSAVLDIPQGTDGATVLVTAAIPSETAAVIAADDAHLDTRSLKHALALTGCIDVDDLIEKADIGRSLMRAIEAHSALGILKGWVPGDNPADVIDHLVALATTLENQIAALHAARVADAAIVGVKEKRRFIITGRVRQDNVLKDIGSTVDLTEIEHAEMLGTLAIASPWEQGFTI